jgi:hypothetical protein
MSVREEKEAPTNPRGEPLEIGLQLSESTSACPSKTGSWDEPGVSTVKEPLRR